jgi:hypothetical protein
VEDNGLARLDPLLDVARRECDEVGDRGGEDISIRCQYCRFVLEQVVQVAFKLLDAAGALLLLLGAVAFAVTEQPEGVALGEEGAEQFAVPFVVVEFDGRMSSVHEVLLEVAP